MNTTLLLTLFVLVFAFKSAKAILVDTDGDPIINGGSYHILPAFQNHGGLTLDGNLGCPFNVVQAYTELALGYPTILYSPARILYLPSDFMMEFLVQHPPLCAAKPARWTIVGEESETKHVKILGHEHEEARAGGFKILKYEAATYKMVYCPIGEGSCRALGLANDVKFFPPLVISDDDDPYVVVFRKVEQFPFGKSRARSLKW